MNKASLIDMVQSQETLSNGLKACGQSHVNYKLYTSMERAMAVLLSGHLYLSNGENWNDTHDRKVMAEKKAYGLCFSFSTRESVAMWMLYGRNLGKEGAMLNFPRGIMMDLLKTNSAELGYFEKSQFVTKPEYTMKPDSFAISLSDVIYTDECSNGKLKLTHADEHVTASADLLNHDDVFHKSIAWQYERECRLIVKPSADWMKVAKDHGLNLIRIVLPERDRLALCKSRLFRSPVYSGSTDYGRQSNLTGKVNWDLR